MLHSYVVSFMLFDVNGKQSRYLLVCFHFNGYCFYILLGVQGSGLSAEIQGCSI